MKTSNFTLSLGLDVKQFHEGLDEICRHLADSRLTAVEALLRDLSGDALQAHVKRLPELSARLEEVRKAKDDLRKKQLVVDQANSNLVKLESLLVLKREAAAQLGTLVAYLEVMAKKDVAVYGEHYAVVTEVIQRLNARRRSKASRFDDDDFEDEEIIEEPEPSTAA